MAIVSQNSARLLTSFFGVSGWGRILVPINFRLAPAEIEYIVGHSGASVLVVDPEVRGLLDTVRASQNFVLGEDDAAVFGELDSPHAVTPDPWSGSETGTATLNYTSGTTSRPKGVQLTHRNIWINAVVFGLHATLRDDDVLLHTLPMFHCNGWGWPYAATGMGARHIVLRKVDGDEILRRVEQHGVTVMCAAPTVVDSILMPPHVGRGLFPGAIEFASSSPERPSDADHRTGAHRAGVGVHPDLWAHRDVATDHDESFPFRVGGSRCAGAGPHAGPRGCPSDRCARIRRRGR